MKILLLILMLPLTAQAQAPFWRNPWTTNQPPAPVKGDNTTTVSNYQTHIWWDFWGTNAFTIAHLIDVTNIVHDATNGFSGGSSTNGLATTNYVNNATNTLYAQTTTDLNAESNALRTFSLSLTNGLSSTTNPTFYGSVYLKQTNGNPFFERFYATNNTQYAELRSPDNIQTNNVLVWPTNAIAGALVTSTVGSGSSAKNQLRAIPNGTGAFTNDGSGGFGYFNSFATTSYADATGAGARGFSLQATNFGSNIGGATNLLVIVETNLTTFATNSSGAGGTNSIKFNTAQPITTTASPSFAGLAVTGDQTNTGALNIAGGVTNWSTVRNKSGMTNDSNVLTVGAVENRSTSTNTGAINNAAAVTNWSTLNQAGAQTNQAAVDVTGAFTAYNSVVNLAANVTDYVTPTKNRVFTSTNNSGGGRWLSAVPYMTRRRSGYWEPTGPGGLQVLGDSAATTGSASTANAGTNVWPEATYATAASANADAGVSGGATTAATYSPGRNCYAAFNGRISQTSTQRVWIGLTGAVLATINASDAPTTASLAAIRFSTSAANTNFCFVTCDGSACTTTVGNITGVTTNRHRWEIIEDDANNRWIAYMDGLPLATNTANLPISTLQPLFSVRTLEATAKTIRLEAYYGEQDFISGQPFIQ